MDGGNESFQVEDNLGSEPRTNLRNLKRQKAGCLVHCHTSLVELLKSIFCIGKLDQVDLFCLDLIKFEVEL